MRVNGTTYMPVPMSLFRLPTLRAYPLRQVFDDDTQRSGWSNEASAFVGTTVPLSGTALLSPDPDSTTDVDASPSNPTLTITPIGG